MYLALLRLRYNLLYCMMQINHLVDIPASNPFLTPISNVHSTRGHNMRLMQPMTRIDSYNICTPFSLQQLKSGMIYPKM